MTVAHDVPIHSVTRGGSYVPYARGRIRLAACRRDRGRVVVEEGKRLDLDLRGGRLSRDAPGVHDPPVPQWPCAVLLSRSCGLKHKRTGDSDRSHWDRVSSSIPRLAIQLRSGRCPVPLISGAQGLGLVSRQSRRPVLLASAPTPDAAPGSPVASCPRSADTWSGSTRPGALRGPAGRAASHGAPPARDGRRHPR